ncbi:MAG: hypothetical protein U1B80_06670, partial [Anaerolineaceae bacterium]|nr:hypothetical protein [Anaerolineaceae bacterium]
MRSAKSAGKTRAEIVRQRRTQQTQPVAKQSLTALQYTPPVAPVFVRGGLSTPVVQRARSKVRRPVAIPLGSPGVELHLPSLPAFRPGWRLFSGMLTILLSTLLALVAFSSEYTTGTPQIHGIHRLSNAVIQTVVDINGKQAFMIDPRQIAWQLASAFPELRDISV